MLSTLFSPDIISFARSFLPYTVNDLNRHDPTVRCAANVQVSKSKCSVPHEHQNYIFYYGSRSLLIFKWPELAYVLVATDNMCAIFLR